MFGLSLSRLRNRRIRARFQGKELHPLARENLSALDHLDLNQRAKSLRYVVFDMETTGLNLSSDRVISAAAFQVVEGRIPLGDVFSSLVNPGRAIPSSSIKIHGIVPSMVAEAPSFTEVFDEFLRFLGTDILVGYHTRFDLHFMNVYMQQRYGFPLQNLVLDVQPMCRKVVFPSHLRSCSVKFSGNQDLDLITRHFGIDVYDRHTALGDALATAMVFQHLLEELEKRGPGLLRNLLAAGRIR
jgi:DNA polymerase-3 subunit epsilon